MNQLPCTNCRRPVEPETAKLFAEVFLCEACFDSASHFHNRLLAELQRLVTIAKEAIRVSLIEGRFFFPEASDLGATPSKKDVLELLMSMEEQRQQKASRRCTEIQDSPTQVPPCTESTLPPAPTQVASASGNSPTDKPRG